MQFMTEHQSPLKKEIKKLIYAFMDDLEIAPESSIDLTFIKKLSNLLPEVKKQESFDKK